jgi:hypothetical protein
MYSSGELLLSGSFTGSRFLSSHTLIMILFSLSLLVRFLFIVTQLSGSHAFLVLSFEALKVGVLVPQSYHRDDRHNLFLIL